MSIINPFNISSTQTLKLVRLLDDITATEFVSGESNLLSNILRLGLDKHIFTLGP